MKRISTGFVLCLSVLLAGCSSVNVDYDWDTDAFFPGYKTFAWIEQSNESSGEAQEALARNSLLDQRVKKAVNASLEAKGISLVDTNPDMLVVYHTGVQDKINVTDWGYRYGDAYWGYGGRNIDVTQYTEGTLVLDLIDASNTQLVWRAIATKVIEQNVSPQQMEKNINDIVRKMLDPYPPKK